MDLGGGGNHTHGMHNGALWPSHVRDGAISHHLLCAPASPLLSAVRDALQLPSNRLGCLAIHFGHRPSFKCLSGMGWGIIYCTTWQECCRWGMFGHDKRTFPLLFPPTTYVQLVVAVANTPCVAWDHLWLEMWAKHVVDFVALHSSTGPWRQGGWCFSPVYPKSSNGSVPGGNCEPSKQIHKRETLVVTSALNKHAWIAFYVLNLNYTLFYYCSGVFPLVVCLMFHIRA